MTFIIVSKPSTNKKKIKQIIDKSSKLKTMKCQEKLKKKQIEGYSIYFG